mmetsp:Transcript_29880/g.45753  ORF Transcript_29880/g.45753 Transcript_29880/m.45753 type:complete len:106 (+) Transcript_29880:57-374(+)
MSQKLLVAIGVLLSVAAQPVVGENLRTRNIERSEEENETRSLFVPNRKRAFQTAAVTDGKTRPPATSKPSSAKPALSKPKAVPKKTKVIYQEKGPSQKGRNPSKS